MRKKPFYVSTVVSIAALLLCFVSSGCVQQQKRPAAETPRSAPPASSSAATPAAAGPASAGPDMFDLKSHPDAIVMKPLDPATLTPTQLQFGIAPRHDPRVDYQPDIILMEQGDKAIRSIATNGIIWTFDANAPHVNEFAMGKIVFATGRAVGRIAMLKRVGDDVQVILLPVQIHDLIARGSFAMDSDLDLSKAIPFVYPDFPQPQDEQAGASPLPVPGVDQWKGTIVVSRVSKSGKWTPVNMTTVSADGERKRFQRTGASWTAMPVFATAPVFASAATPPAPPRVVRAAYEMQSGLPQVLRMPGVPGPQIKLPVLPNFNPPTVPNLPALNVQDLVPGLIAQKEGVGVTFTYDKEGIRIAATALLNFSGLHARSFITAGSGVIPKDCGIELEGVVGVHLHLKSATDQNWHVNIRKVMYLPISLWIPIAGPVPFAITLDQALAINTGFSARANSVLNAEGRYAINGNLKAGYFNGDWVVNPGLTATAKTDIGNTTEGISIGISSLLLGAHLRVMLGLGAGPFNFGVYATLVYTGTILKAPDEVLPCRQGTMVVVLRSGIGYSLPELVARAVNYFLGIFTDKRIEAKGTVADGPEQKLLTVTTSFPDGCSSPKGGG